MANQKRTEHEILVIDNFDRVNQLVDELKLSKGFSPWLEGLYSNSKRQLTRIPGKLLNQTGTTGGRVLSLHQLSFADKTFLIIHQSTNILMEEDLTSLMDTTDVSTLVPTEPFIFS